VRQGQCSKICDGILDELGYYCDAPFRAFFIARGFFMGTVGKVILGIVAAIVLVVILAVIGVVLWWQKGGGKEMAKSAIESAEKSEKEGKDFAKNADNEQCVAEALQRDRRNSSMSGAIGTNLFLQGCLRASKETPGFCTGVPKPTQLIDGPRWQIDQCRKRGAANDQFCPQLMQKIQEHCYIRN
jgi:hypothetical protein